MFDAVQRQWDQHGYIARSGQMVDASLILAPRQKLTKEQKGLIKEKAQPADWKAANRRQKDCDAPWAKKHGKSYYGYKLSMSSDKRNKLIRKLKISTAGEHDTPRW